MANKLDWAKIDSAVDSLSKEGYSEEQIRQAVGDLVKEMSNPGPWASGYTTPDKPDVPRLPPRESLPEVQDNQSLTSRVGRKAKSLGKWFVGMPDSEDPGLRRQLDAGWQGAANAYTLGLHGRATDAIGATTQEGREALAAEEPVAAGIGRNIGGIAGGVAGPARAIGETMTRGVVSALPRLSNSALGRVAQAGAAGGLSGAATGGIEDGAEGAAAGALLGAGVGAGLSGIGEGASWVGGKLKGDNWIGRYVRARDSGALEQAKSDTKGGAVSKGKPGIRDAAIRAREQVLARDAEMADEAGGTWRGKVQAERPKSAPVESVRTRLLEAGIDERASSGVPIGKGRVRAKAAEVLGQLGDDPTVDDMLKVRGALDDEAGFGSPAPTGAQRAARTARSAVRAGVREASPAVAAADDEYTAFKQKQARRNDILFRSEDGGRIADLPPPTEDAVDSMGAPLSRRLRVGDEIKAMTALGRLGDDTEEGLRLAPYLKELADQDPAFARALADLEAKKALEATRFTLNPALQGNLTDVTKGAGFMRTIGANARALGARGVLPIVEGGEQAAKGFSRLGPAGIAAALAAEKERDRRRAEKVRRKRGGE